MVDNGGASNRTSITLVLLVFAIPLLPRITFGGVASAITAVGIACVIAVTFIRALTRGRQGGLVILPGHFLTVYILLLCVAVYGARSFVTGDRGEITAVLSRVVLILLIVCFSYTFEAMGARKLLVAYGVGVTFLASLALVISITGISVFESPRPSRDLGVTLPFLKTAGVPRSFGEQGIVVAIVLAFVLVYWRQLSTLLRITLVCAVIVIELTGQSRNMLLSLFLVVLAWLVVRRGVRKLTAAFLLILAGASTFLVEQVFPQLSATELGEAVIGEGIYQANVQSRFSLTQGALELLRSDPARALIGWSHSEWLEVAPNSLEATIHNHFIALLVFMGLPMGLLSIWLMFVRPLSRLVSSHGEALGARNGNIAKFVVVSGCGVLSSLNFYEGFFSISLALYIGLLWAVAYRVPSGLIPLNHQRRRMSTYGLE